MKALKRVKLWVGAVLLDLPRLLKCLVAGRSGWVDFCNRRDRLISAGLLPGISQEDGHTSELHLCRVIPVTGRVLMRRAFRDCPVRLGDSVAEPGLGPKVAFLIGHRGVERLPNLLMTLASIAGQVGVDVECVVVEMDTEPRIRDSLPPWVRYVFVREAEGGLPYNRSSSFNVAAEHTAAPLLILHDNDLVVPAQYAKANWDEAERGAEVVNLKRFIFYLGEQNLSSALELIQRVNRGACEVDRVVQNLLGGGSLGITREAFRRIGGMDEDFVGWGGEDVEFWERCQTLKVCNRQYLPLAHVWHREQPGKRAIQGLGALTAELFARKMAVPASERVQNLLKRRMGTMGGIE